jgi:hypothetical protein
MRRREFLRVASAAGLAATLPWKPVSAYLPATQPDESEWDNFLGRIRLRMMEIVRREGRGPHRVVIDPPHVSAGTHYRRVRLTLDAGGSPLDRISYQWDEVWRGF